MSDPAWPPWPPSLGDRPASMDASAPNAALCVHEWAWEAEPVVVVRPAGYRLVEETKAFPCTVCGSLLVMAEREG